MNKKFLALMTGALMFSGVGTFVACSDYDDDIDGLSSRLDKVEAAVAELQKSIDAGAVITDVVENENGIKITLSNGKSYELTNGKDGKPGSTVKIGEDGFWYVDGVKTQYPAQGPQGPQGKDGIYFEPGLEGAANGFWVKVDAEGKKTVTDMRWAPADGNVITAVLDGEKLVVKGVKGAKEDVVINLKVELKSLVFEPSFYYQGIEAQYVDTYHFNYEKVTYDKVNADKDFSKDAASDIAPNIHLTPAVTMRYAVNPTNAKLPVDLKGYELELLDKKYVRSEGAPKATVTGTAYSNGILSVTAKLTDGLVKELDNQCWDNPNFDADKNLVTTFALTVNNEDNSVSSDWAALKPVKHNGIELADARKGVRADFHWYKSAKAAIEHPEAATIEWNDEDGIDIAPLVQTHIDTVGTCTAVDRNAGDGVMKSKGFEYTYELVGYYKGDYETSESAHAQFNPEKPSWIRAQLTHLGKQQAWGFTQSKATVDREPLVRVTLWDLNGASKKRAAVGYIKFRIVYPKVEDKEIIIEEAFEMTDPYTVTCPMQGAELKTLWHEIEERIIHKTELSKTEFEKNYKPDGAMVESGEYFLMNQFSIRKSGDKVVASRRNPFFGDVKWTYNDDHQTMTNVIKWSVSAEEAFKQFYGQKQGASVETVIRWRYTHVVDEQTTNKFVYVTLKWTPTALNATPSGVISDNNKIKEHWYTKWTNNNTGWDEVHMNVTAPGRGVCEFTTNYLNWFVKNTINVTEINPVYKGLQNNDLDKSLEFVDLTEYNKVKGSTGNVYTIYPKAGVAGVSELWAKLGVKSQLIAKLNNSDNTISYMKYAEDPAQYSFAGDILNGYNHLNMGNGKPGETVAARVKIVAESCIELPLSNNEFNVRFQRPINMEINDKGIMVDAQNYGSSVALDSLLDFTDWRSNDPVSFFKDHNWYFGYYGVKRIVIANTSDLVPVLPAGSEQTDNAFGERYNKVDVTAYAMTNLNQTDRNKFVKLTDVTKKLILEFEQAQVPSLHNMGLVTYHNNGENINDVFKLQLPIVVEYDWGCLRGTLNITVNPTLGNN